MNIGVPQSYVCDLVSETPCACVGTFYQEVVTSLLQMPHFH